MIPPPPLILDCDGSVLPVAANEIRLPLASFQEDLRFGCSGSFFQTFSNRLKSELPERFGCAFTGSGDFHHLTALLLSLRADSQPVDVVVCDNHPDNMRYPFGIHCGSWVFHACRMTRVRSVHVIGITSEDIGWRHAWENYLSPFFSGKLTYWSLDSRASWLDWLGLAVRHRCFTAPEDLLSAFLPELAKMNAVYLSLDKDVLASNVIRTNWDQGRFTEEHLRRIIEACAGKVVGADICGDFSEYRYKGLFKRLLSSLDGQEQAPLEERELQTVREAHQALNKRLIGWIDEARKG